MPAATGEAGAAEPPERPAGPGHPALPREGSGGRGQAASLRVPRKCPDAVQVSSRLMSSPALGAGAWVIRPGVGRETENQTQETESKRGAAESGRGAGTPIARRWSAERAPALLPPHNTSLQRPQPP